MRMAFRLFLAAGKPFRYRVAGFCMRMPLGGFLPLGIFLYLRLLLAAGQLRLWAAGFCVGMPGGFSVEGGVYTLSDKPGLGIDFDF